MSVDLVSTVPPVFARHAPGGLAADAARATTTPPAPAQVPALHVADVSMSFGRITALEHVSLAVQPGELLCVLGPSGSGKSTLLRLIAGMDRPTSGTIAVHGQQVAGARAFVEPEHRRVGMVFQDYALFPHLTVAANIAFGLTGSPRVRAARVAALLDQLGLSRYAASYPHMLSGGERQRVALARALAPEPRLLLMDEPFSSLDGELRTRVRQDTVALLRRLGTTTVIVTHDPAEAMGIADRLALMHAGRLIQVGTPAALYARPVTMAAARLLGDVNAVPGICRAGWIDTPLGRFAAGGIADGMPAAVGIRPQHVRTSLTGPGAGGRVVSVAFAGDADVAVVSVEGLAVPLSVRIPGRPAPAVGEALRVEIRPEDAFVVAH